MILRDTNTAIPDLQGNAAIDTRHADLHLALFGELECVRQQIGHNLKQALGIGVNTSGCVVTDPQRTFQTLLHCQWIESLHQSRQGFLEVHVFRFKIHLAGFDLGQIENVVDQLQQTLTAVVNDLRRFDLFRVQVIVQVIGQCLGQDQHRVQWRAQLMRHIGQEFTLVAAGLLQLNCTSLLRHSSCLKLGLTQSQRFCVFFHSRIDTAQLFCLCTQVFFRRLELPPLRFELLGAPAEGFVD